MTRRMMGWCLLAMGIVAGSSCTGRRVDPSLLWVGNNTTHLDDLLAARGQDGPSFDPSEKPVAVFDWDNTVIKNDVGDATTFWMLRNDKILQPPNKNWATTSPFLCNDGVYCH